MLTVGSWQRAAREAGVLDYIVAAQPSVVLKLLDQLDAAEALSQQLTVIEDRLAHSQQIVSVLAKGAEQLAASAIKGSPAEIRTAFEAFSKLLDGVLQ